MKKVLFILCGTIWLNCQAQKAILPSSDSGGVQFILYNSIDKKVKIYTNLSGILIVDDSIKINFITDLKQGSFRAKMPVGKHNIKLKTATLCLYELINYVIHKDESFLLTLNIPTKNNPNDTCVIKDNYGVRDMGKDMNSVIDARPCVTLIDSYGMKMMRPRPKQPNVILQSLRPN